MRVCLPTGYMAASITAVAFGVIPSSITHALLLVSFLMKYIAKYLSKALTAAMYLYEKGEGNGISSSGPSSHM